MFAAIQDTTKNYYVCVLNTPVITISVYVYPSSNDPLHLHWIHFWFQGRIFRETKTQCVANNRFPRQPQRTRQCLKQLQIRNHIHDNETLLHVSWLYSHSSRDKRRLPSVSLYDGII